MRSDITEELKKRLDEYININNIWTYAAKEVTFGYGEPGQIRVDCILFKPANTSVSGIEKGDFYCYEIKSCSDDFHSGHGLNFIGDFNYLVMPKDVYKELQAEIPYGTGVLVPDGDSLKSVKKAVRKRRERASSEMLFAMLRSAVREGKR